MAMARRAMASMLLLLLIGGAPAAAAESRSSDYGTQRPGVSFAEVERVLAEQLDESGIAGGAVAVVSGAGIEASGVGSASESEFSADTPFVIGSATKSFTALAVMQLVDSGRIELDAPVREYVPEFALAGGQPVNDISVRHLLQQTSGLDDLAGGPLLASAAQGAPEEAIAELRGAELASQPGETWRYANANYVLAGLAVERASGLAFADYLQREIFTPLGMTHTSATAIPVAGTEVADGHRYWFGVPVATAPVRRDATLAAGYLISTAGDLGRYLSMFLAEGLGPDGTRIVSATGLQTLIGAGPEARLGPWAQGQYSHYAMGWFVGGPWNNRAVFHPGNTPDTTTMLAFFPDRGLAVAAVVAAGNELPVPGNPFIADRVTRNVVHAALGQQVLDLPSVGRFYLAFDLVALLLVGAAAWGLLRAGRAVLGRHPARHRLRSGFGVLVRAAAAGLLVLVPTLSYGWGGLWTWAPDLAVVIATVALLLTLTAALRVIRLLPTISGARPSHLTNSTEGGRAHASA